MSRIGKQPIAIPPKVKVEVKGQQVLVEGPKGKLNFELPRRTSLKVEGANVVVSRQGDDSEARALHGLSRALVNNMVRGVSEGFVKKSWDAVAALARDAARLPPLLVGLPEANTSDVGRPRAVVAQDRDPNEPVGAECGRRRSRPPHR